MNSQGVFEKSHFFVAAEVTRLEYPGKLDIFTEIRASLPRLLQFQNTLSLG